ncbi:hypothetical protein E2P86_04210 [Sphingobacterium psychroaquaticum]|uniref:hypothetical protein n=1 Tax=Sphingobacterium psychroaquaticum TaxID=561061 RepID=UPI00106AEEB9|nr:hypothetical protein [Sphingobacterium psychroaquaticum]QBQ40397.1 hypothetical protein E2P86_04210 [Sphingobacterium psychroaquaticum]
MKALYICAMLLVGLFLTGCNKDEAVPYDNPFFYIHENNSSEIRIASNRNETLNYLVYFSGKRQFDPMTLTYEVIVGNGLQEGRDFEVVTPEYSLTFAPGIVEMPIKIRWIPHAIDPEKDNSVTIKLSSNNKGYILGLPGPNKVQASLRFIKF